MKKFQVSIPYWYAVVVDVQADKAEQAKERALKLATRGEGKEIQMGIIEEDEEHKILVQEVSCSH